MWINRATFRDRRARVATSLAAVATICASALLVAACGGGDDAAPAPPTDPTPAAVPAPPSGLAPTPEPAPSAAPDYEELASDYAAIRDPALADGRELIDALIGGDPAPLRARFSADLQATLSEQELQAAVAELRSERVFFEIEQVGASWAGQLSGDEIKGVFKQGGVGEFSLERSSGAEPGAPLDGTWEGSLAIATVELAMVVSFSTSDDEVAASIDIPEQGTLGLLLDNVRYEPSLAIGERTIESVLPLDADRLVYVSEFSWGQDLLVTTVVFEPDGTISDLVPPQPRTPLPPDPAEGYSSETEFRLPFDGIWWVFWGGETELQNYHTATPVQRHAYDLVIWRAGDTHRGEGSENEEYWVWQEPVLAPAAGTVVDVSDGLADNTPGVLNTESHPAGNYVVLQTGEREFLHIGHFRQASIEVAEGDRVESGDVIGLTGNSGNSSEPHIHIHLQDSSELLGPTAQGLPLVFSDYLADGEPVPSGTPLQEQFIEHAAR